MSFDSHSDCVTHLAKITNRPLLPDRHAFLTIRNLTHCTGGFIECSTMNVITVRRTVFHGLPREAPVKRIVINGGSKKTSAIRRSFRDLARTYFAKEHSLEFAAEALLFVIIVAISAWPILAAAGALHEFFQHTLS